MKKHITPGPCAERMQTLPDATLLLFRLTYALETAKDMSWNYRLLSDREWSGRHALALNAGVNGVYLSRTNLYAAFDDNGRQINPLLTRPSGFTSV